MWPSPSNIPTNISYISFGNFIKALSNEDKHPIPFVERTAYVTKLNTKNNIEIYKLILSMLIT